MVDQALCAICADGMPTPVICIRCEQRLRRDLDTVGKLRADLDPRPGRGRSSGKAPGKPGSRPPANITALSATDTRSSRIWEVVNGKHRPGADDVINVDAMLLGWGRITVEERSLTLALRDVFDVIRILNLSFDWWCRHPAVQEFSGELHACAIALRQLCGDINERSVGRCPAAHEQRDACGGPLRLGYTGDLPDDPDEAVIPTHVVCGWCGDVWPLERDTLVAMLRVVRPKAFPVPRSWAADVCGVAVGTIDVWVHRGHVTVYADKQVNLMDVLVRLNDTPGAG